VTCETLLTSRADGVARIALDRPEVRNALSRSLSVLSGAGDKAFSFFAKRPREWTGR
jgi:1,4-dihydroxy-2-naphthoyl-CoA synthase